MELDRQEAKNRESRGLAVRLLRISWLGTVGIWAWDGGNLCWGAWRKERRIDVFYYVKGSFRCCGILNIFFYLIASAVLFKINVTAACQGDCRGGVKPGRVIQRLSSVPRVCSDQVWTRMAEGARTRWGCRGWPEGHQWDCYWWWGRSRVMPHTNWCGACENLETRLPTRTPGRRKVP